jgi:aspartyl-tRNA(Asn)/glutamyl-tRNA(Gln) amidotransferase subunit A
MTIAGMMAELARGATTSRRLCETALARATDPAGQGRAVFTEIFEVDALAQADAADRLRSSGASPGPLCGIPVSVKDLFDVAGYPTRAGAARVRRDAAPAAADAAIVARLRAAGAVIVGKTNMTEFAYSGLGLNPHYGTPLNPYDRAAGRIPGGSSSGAAVSVSDGMAAAAIGTDTGGSVRIPAALCGLTGWKPTARRIPRDGCFPLSGTFDSIGPIAHDVADCVTLDAVLSGDTSVVLPRYSRGLRLLAPENVVFESADAAVVAAFERALARLGAAGARIERGPWPWLDRYAAESKTSRLLAAEAYRLHAAELDQRPERFDPRVGGRIATGRAVSAAEYAQAVELRESFAAGFLEALAGYDAAVWPTVPVIAPLLADLADDDDAYARANLLVLRNTSIVNAADGCAISLPVEQAGEPPAGLQLAAPAGADGALLGCALAVEEALKR